MSTKRFLPLKVTSPSDNHEIVKRPKTRGCLFYLLLGLLVLLIHLLNK